MRSAALPSLERAPLSMAERELVRGLATLLIADMRRIAPQESISKAPLWRGPTFAVPSAEEPRRG
jgi:hypothetical protein